MYIEHIKNKDVVLAIILRNEYTFDGISFLTPGEFSQQLGYMKRQKGYIIQPHVHNKVSREVFFTSEVLFIKKGAVRVDFYDAHTRYLESSTLKEGDVILLVEGGHGFEMLENSEIIEVKQGPYIGESDKTRFASSSGS